MHFVRLLDRNLGQSGSLFRMLLLPVVRDLCDLLNLRDRLIGRFGFVDEGGVSLRIAITQL